MTDHPLSQGTQMFANRLRKNLKHLSRWLKRENIHCYRLYDADMPEYAIAVDIYENPQEGKQPRIHVQEYEAPKSIDADKAAARLQDALSAILDVMNISKSQLFLKVRRQQKGSAQYEKIAVTKEFHEVIEAGNRFLVNFQDYLDTGLFLDHRITRGLLAELIRESTSAISFLNLFSYTGSATVYAAKGGATHTTTVDMSRTYLDWAQRNMALNNFSGPQHEFVQANCLDWLLRMAGKRKYDLIFLDPPSFSTSKRMQSTFDVQRDHVELIKRTVALLAPAGTLIFSNNNRRFKMDRAALQALDIKDISKATLPKDFERNPKIHNCWKITQKEL